MVNELADSAKCEAMIEMLEAFDVALSVRAEKWAEEAGRTPRVVLSPREDKRNKAHVLECKIRIDEIREICKLVARTIETCREQSAPDAVERGPMQ